MNARLPKSWDQLPASEKKAIWKAIYSEVAKNAAQMVHPLAQEMAKNHISYTIECCLDAGLIVLHDDFGWGTDTSRLGKRQSKLIRYSDGFLKVLTDAGTDYDESMAEGLRFQLRSRGIEIVEQDYSYKDKTVEELQEAIRAKLEAKGEEDKK